MSRPFLRYAALLAAFAASATALGGCGKTGELARPKPLFGHPSATAQAPQRQGQDPSRPVQTIDQRDMDRGPPQPARSDPIQGQGPDPTGVPPPTAMPDPYANPGRFGR
jgi:hypothetical protein